MCDRNKRDCKVKIEYNYELIQPAPNELYTRIECPQCGFEGSREISVKDEDIMLLKLENARLRKALYEISLCANNSMSSRGECGSIAHKALMGTT
jgi:hypothetical protein